MEHPFFAANTTRAEALRWLTIAEKLLSVRDLMGSKSFAMRARDSDPTLSQPDQILAVADTLLAGDIRIGNNQHDWYSILRLTPSQGLDPELVATQYRSLVLLLNPQQNISPFAEQAFRLVIDAWSVLSNPSRKSMYDKELAFFGQRQQQEHQPEPFSNPMPTVTQNMFFGGSPASSGVAQPQVHVGTNSTGSGTSHFVHVQQAQPEHQNYMSFTSGSNIAFGSATRSNSSVEHANKSKETFPAFGEGNVSYSFGTNQEQMKQKNPQDNYFSACDITNHNSNIRENEEEGREEEDFERRGVQVDERVDEPANQHGEQTFWTACPYCYHMYEYPSMYTGCSLKCQNCRRAFQGVVIPSPPPTTGGGNYFCCWGFMPMGLSMETWEKNKAAAPAWTPFSPMFTLPQMENMNSANKRRGGPKNSGPRVYVDEDEVFVEFSETSNSDDDDWQKNSEKKNKRRTM